MLSANFWLIVLSLHTGPKVRTASPPARGYKFFFHSTVYTGEYAYSELVPFVAICCSDLPHCRTGA